jgi:hypothetical protein
MPTLPFSTRLILLAALPRLSAACSWVSRASSRSLRSSLPSWRRWIPTPGVGLVIRQGVTLVSRIPDSADESLMYFCGWAITGRNTVTHLVASARFLLAG